MSLELATLPRKTVMLLHETADGSSHVDWLIAGDVAGEAPLISFRLAKRLDEMAESASMLAERAPDHRPAYLSIEHSVLSANRGTVRRIAAGTIIEYQSLETGGCRIVVKWDGTGAAGGAIEQHLRLLPEKQSQSLVFCDSIRRCS